MRKYSRGLYRDLDHNVEEYDVLIHNKKALTLIKALAYITSLQNAVLIDKIHSLDFLTS